MAFTVLEPEVAGGLGPKTVLDPSVHPPLIKRLHYEFEGWLGDDLVESFPCFVVSERLARELQQSSLAGFVLDDVKVTTSPEFDELHPELRLPKFRWLRITGIAGRDDFGLGKDHRLVASEAAMGVLSRFKIEHADRSTYSEGAV